MLSSRGYHWSSLKGCANITHGESCWCCRWLKVDFDAVNLTDPEITCFAPTVRRTPPLASFPRGCAVCQLISRFNTPIRPSIPLLFLLAFKPFVRQAFIETAIYPSTPPLATIVPTYLYSQHMPNDKQERPHRTNDLG
jgi:hypothetical protein